MSATRLRSAPAGRYALHGLHVESDLPLDGRDPTTDAPPDLHIRLSDRASQPATGTLVAGDATGRLYATVRTTHGFATNVLGVGVFTIDASLSEAVCALEHGADVRMASILASGNLIATVLGLRGVGVLHAGTVAAGGRAITVAAGSGMGKSTIAALLCGAGATLVGDDVLRVDEFDGAMWCLPGSPTIRLRPQAAALADAFGGGERTVDERIAVRPPPATAPVPLAAVLLPLPSREVSATQIVRLPKSKAAAELMACARIFGWRDGDALQAQFRLATRIASAVPVMRAVVPWGPPFAPEIAPGLMRACGVSP